MKKLILAGLLATTLTVWADDKEVFQNSDFSSGVSEWEGDIHTAGGSADDSGATTGGVVKLKDWWTKVSQDFEAPSGSYNLAIKYTVTPNFSLSKRRDDYANVNGPLGLNDLLSFNADTGKWFVLIVDLDAWTCSTFYFTPSTKATGEQTAHAAVHFSGADNQNKRIFLCYPPGTGTVNLLGVTLTKR
jgi:hypothetical protein